MIRAFTALIFCSIFCFFATATEPGHAFVTGEEKEIQARAKKKLYPGGRDEEPLKVQAQLPQSIRRLGPNDEAPAEPSSDD